MSSREIILQRIREALSVEAPMPGAHGHDHAPTFDGAVESHFKEWLPVAGETFEEQAALFAKNAQDLRADFRLLDSPASFASELKALAEAESWKKIAVHQGELTDIATCDLTISKLAAVPGFDRNEMESCDAGVTECDALVAQTGTVVLTTRSAGGRALSVLPPHHIVLARRAQMVPDLPAAFALLKDRYGSGFPSMMSLVSGPSRTADIERILVLGAHGPKKLTIICG